MPTLADLKQSRFLTKADVNPPKLVTIAGYKFGNVAMESEPPDNKYMLNFSELDKPMVLNQTNGDLIALATGSDDFDEWIGKQIVLFVDPTVSHKGKVIGGIRCRAPKVRTTPVAPAPAPLPAPVKTKPAPAPEPVDPAEPEEDDVPF